MLFLRNRKIKGIKNDRLITYLTDSCDMVSFHLPKFHEDWITEKNQMAFPPNKPHGRYIGDDEEWKMYRENVSELLEYLDPYIIKKYEDVEYCESIFGHATEICYVSLTREASKYFFEPTGNLYEWLYPNLPEDLCFYRKGECFLKSIAHEKECWIYTNEDYDKWFLKKIGLKYQELPHESPPMAHYSVEY